MVTPWEDAAERHSHGGLRSCVGAGGMLAVPVTGGASHRGDGESGHPPGKAYPCQ